MSRTTSPTPPAPLAWADRRVPEAMSPEKLGALVEREISRSDDLLFTLTPRAELDEIGRWQQLADQAWVGQQRAIVAAHNRAGDDRREFACDEVALAINASPITGSRLSADALSLAALPGLLEAVSAGMLTSRHALAVLRELDKVSLTLELRCSIVLIALARFSGQTPGELGKLIARLILSVDLAAAQNRQDTATAQRCVSIYPDVDGQGIVHGRGPLQQVAAIKAALKRWLTDHPKEADDARTESEREWDLFVSLLTGGAETGSWQAAIIVPFSTVKGTDLELSEIPGLGPILPSTARDLLEHTETFSQVSVDEDGIAIAVSDPTPGPRPAPQPDTTPTPEPAPSAFTAQPHPRPSADREWLRDEQWWSAMRLLMSTPPPERLMPEQLSSDSYRTPSRLHRYLQARDRTCVFPGCHRRITDVDHRIPWPLGPTAAWNLVNRESALEASWLAGVRWQVLGRAPAWLSARQAGAGAGAPQRGASDQGAPKAHPLT